MYNPDTKSKTMKAILTLVLMTASATISFSQDDANEKRNGYFIVLYTIAEKWDTTK
ncbi:hypothetical protein WSM22_35820 [Cytophagales bacterium WSM2-2]|nr:hypothetical protein WSM22_35820 [Cytophagales bacterium WSM2-2]